MTLPVDYEDATEPTGALTELPATTARGINAINTQINVNTAALETKVDNDDARLTDARTPTDGSVTTAKFDAATLVTEADGIAANDNDTTIPTSAAVKAYADSLGGGGGGTPDDGSVTTAKFDAAALVTEAEGLASSDNDTSIPTTAAVKDYVDDSVASAGGGDMLKAVYDPTTVEGDAFDQDNMVDGTTNKNFTAAEKTKLAGVESSADVTDAGNVGAAITGATSKTTPVDADEVALIDSAASNVLKKLTWANLKAAIKSYYDSVAATMTNKTLTNPTINNYVEGVVAIGNSGTAKTIDLTSGTVQTMTLTGNVTVTMPTATAGKSFVLLLKTGAGSFTATFTGVKWPAGTAPTITTTASRLDMFTFVADGTNWYGASAQNYTP